MVVHLVYCSLLYFHEMVLIISLDLDLSGFFFVLGHNTECLCLYYIYIGKTYLQSPHGCMFGLFTLFSAIAEARGLRPASGTLQLLWTLHHSLMQ